MVIEKNKFVSFDKIYLVSWCFLPSTINLKKVFLISFFLIASLQYAQRFEVRMLQKIHRDSTFFLDHTFKFASNTILPVTIGTPIAIRLYGLSTNDDAMVRNGFKTAASFLLSSILTTSIKIGVKRKRPFAEFPELFHQKQMVGKLSFPSGHTSTAFAMATAISLSNPKWYVITPCFLWAGAVAYSRMYLGLHFPSDVFGGIVIGVGSSLIIWGIDKALTK